MSDKTAIEWTDATWNPTTGCDRISPGCANCYAKTLHDMRHKAVTEGKRLPVQYQQPFEVVQTWENRLTAPLKWRMPKRVFVNSVSDLFHADVPDAFIDRVFATMALAPHHAFQVLTKRAARMRDYLTSESTPFRVAKAIDVLKVSAAAAQFPHEMRPIKDCPGYLVDNTGQVFTTLGSGNCVWCGILIAESPQDARFCGVSCRSASHYAKSQRRNPEPAGASMRRVKPERGASGHLRVQLSGHGRELVHRLVLAAFDRAPVGDEQACHRDGNPANCHIANLQWGDQPVNWADRKRHGRHRSYSKLSRQQVDVIRGRALAGETSCAIAKDFDISDTQVGNIVAGRQWSTNPTIEWPLKSVWLGVSVENQHFADERIPLLLSTPAAVRFISAEPLLASVNLTPYLDGHEEPGTPFEGAPHVGGCVAWTPPLDWVIVGGESGGASRAFQLQWGREIVRQCKAAGVACFVKQLGSTPIFDRDEPLLFIRNRKGGDISEWPADLRLREFPEAVA